MDCAYTCVDLYDYINLILCGIGQYCIKSSCTAKIIPFHRTVQTCVS